MNAAICATVFRIEWIMFGGLRRATEEKISNRLLLARITFIYFHIPVFGPCMPPHGLALTFGCRVSFRGMIAPWRASVVRLA